MKSRHEIEVHAARQAVFDAFVSDGTLIDEVTDKRRPDFVAGSMDEPGCRSIVVAHFEDGNDTTRVTVFVNRFFRGHRKLTAAFGIGRRKQRIDEVLGKFKLGVETAAA